MAGVRGVGDGDGILVLSWATLIREIRMEKPRRVSTKKANPPPKKIS